MPVHKHWVKSVEMRSFFRSLFSRIRTECGEILQNLKIIRYDPSSTRAWRTPTKHNKLKECSVKLNIIQSVLVKRRRHGNHCKKRNFFKKQFFFHINDPKDKYFYLQKWPRSLGALMLHHVVKKEPCNRYYHFYCTRHHFRGHKLKRLII